MIKTPKAKSALSTVNSSTIALMVGVSPFAIAYSASAETLSPSISSILSAMNAAGGSETLQWELAPSYSELFGLGVRATVGGYVNEDFALGVIVDYAEHREEYLANAGVRLNDNMRVIGSVGILKESEEFTLGEGRQDVEQLEYGLGLKGDYEAGIIRGFELNAYATDASSGTDAVETGDLTGVQLVTQLKPSEASDIRFGAGYERAEWAGGDVDEGFTMQAVGSHKLSDVLALNYSAKSAATEDVYGLGLTYDMSSANVQNSALSVSFNEIRGKHGISDDTRVAINWTVGFGGAAGSGAADVTASSMGGMSTPARKDLLAEVMTRPAFLPERVLSRAIENKQEELADCPISVVGIGSGNFFNPDYTQQQTPSYYNINSTDENSVFILFDDPTYTLDSFISEIPTITTTLGGQQVASFSPQPAANAGKLGVLLPFFVDFSDDAPKELVFEKQGVCRTSISLSRIEINF